ncbi:MAG: hypothetical protein LBO78_02030 [Rickettsiales bacterium]|jgi:hypothetical protein|nr:hypothetical protein [Rickettsiales bacterium]
MKKKGCQKNKGKIEYAIKLLELVTATPEGVNVDAETRMLQIKERVESELARHRAMYEEALELDELAALAEEKCQREAQKELEARKSDRAGARLDWLTKPRGVDQGTGAYAQFARRKG